MLGRLWRPAYNPKTVGSSKRGVGQVDKPMEALSPAEQQAKGPRRYLVLLAVTGLVLVLAVLACRRQQPTSEPAFVSPYRNVQPDVNYVGDEKCHRCHPVEAEAFHHHPMGRSLTPIARVAGQERYDKSTGNPFEQFGFEFAVERRGDRVFHKEQLKDSKNRVVFEEEEEAQFVLGSGAIGRSYLIANDGFVFQSPISWFSQKGIWDISPGYADYFHFRRTIEPLCLFCHANQVEPVEGTVNRYRQPIFRGYAIGCERCHGPGELHVQIRARDEFVAGLDDTIVNPRRLEASLRDAVCEQCHLQGESRVLRRGRQLFDYRPGLALHRFWSVFVRKPGPNEKHKAVGQVEQMYGSACYRESKGTLGCISCHDPHQLPAPESSRAYYRDRCLNCHDQKPCSLSPLVRAKKNDNDCIACHMPRAESLDIAHTAVTDHRILRVPEAGGGSLRPPRPLVPGEMPVVHFHRSMATENAEESRDLALALMKLARNARQPPREFGRLALPLLETALQNWPDDVDCREAKGYALWLQGRAEEALASYEAVLAKAPQREQSLADAAALSEQLNQEDAALNYLHRAIEVNPWRAQAHYRLAKILAQRQQWHKAIEACRTAIQRNPSAAEVRTLLITCYLRAGRKDEARDEFAKVMALKPEKPEALRRWFDEQIKAKELVPQQQ